jgi:hypothetical protein
MSTTITNPDAVKPAIMAANTPNDVIKAMIDDPIIKTTILSAFPQILTAQKSPWGMLAGAVIGAGLTRLGVSADPAIVAVAGGIAAVLGGDIYQWASAKWWPATPPAVSTAH